MIDQITNRYALRVSAMVEVGAIARALLEENGP